MNNNNVEKLLNSKKRRALSLSEKEEVWRGVMKSIDSREIAYNWLSVLNNKYMFTSLIIALVVALGGGTVVMADSARPGDVLFGIDRTVENVRLALSSGDNRDKLRIRFAEERMNEVEELRSEDNNSSSTIGVSREIEADVFTNETVVKVELGGIKQVFTTSVKTRAEVVSLVSEKFNIPAAEVESILDFEIEDRASRPNDKVIGSARSVAASLVAKEFLENVAAQIQASGNSTSTAQIVSLINRFNSGGIADDEKIDIRDGDLRIKADGDKIEVRDGDLRVKIDGDKTRYEDGDVRIDVKPGDVRIRSDNSGSDDDSDSNDSSSSSNSSGSILPSGSMIEAEADVFTDITSVKVEVSDVKTVFTTDAKTREGVVNAILSRLPGLTRAKVEEVLIFQIENRASRPQDLD